jgi:hypothetical protein
MELFKGGLVLPTSAIEGGDMIPPPLRIQLICHAGLADPQGRPGTIAACGNPLVAAALRLEISAGMGQRF